LKKNQEAQAEEIKKVPEIQDCVKWLEGQPSASKAVSEALRKAVNVGEHLKFYMLDRTDGERNYVARTTTFPWASVTLPSVLRSITG
jgi:hypothetical protein